MITIIFISFLLIYIGIVIGFIKDCYDYINEKNNCKIISKIIAFIIICLIMTVLSLILIGFRISYKYILNNK